MGELIFCLDRSGEEKELTPLRLDRIALLCEIIKNIYIFKSWYIRYSIYFINIIRLNFLKIFNIKIFYKNIVYNLHRIFQIKIFKRVLENEIG